MGRSAQLVGPKGPYPGSAVAAFLLVNPRSGDGGPSGEELAEAARSRGIRTKVLHEGEDAAATLRSVDADTLGVAGGDGSLAQVAAVAIERDLPFVCVPFGTRNHFARDVGLDRDDPLAALDAFGGDERRVDVGYVGDRLFLNNVSLGLYARLVHRRERHRRRREALARIRAWLIVLTHREPLGLTIDGALEASQLVLVANNAYVLEPPSLGSRHALDEGLLHLYIVRGSVEDRTGTRFVVDAQAGRIDAAVDGEPDVLDTPLEFRIAPRTLRVLLPPGR